VELVSANLTGHSEPRSATEITTSLTQAHPGRKIHTPVVRITLEALVAKGQSQRSKQGRSVYYSPAEAGPATGRAAESAAATA
jgi:DNA-binding transcriptional regulator PaaX